MSNNQFGKLFSFTSWGESHGPAIGCVIDGCPAGLAIQVSDIQSKLDKRRPGQSPFTSPRKEKDQVQILSGVFEGTSTGAPISLLIPNEDARSQDYHKSKNALRPGHANYTYLEKYGIFDCRGGGRSSARETASRVAAGAIANLILKQENIVIATYLKQVGNITCPSIPSLEHISNIEKSSIFCWSPDYEERFINLLDKCKQDNDSIGGVVECVIFNCPTGLGEPIYCKTEALLAQAMLSLPASKGFEIGEGFNVAHMKGSEHNDSYSTDGASIKINSNHAGGTLGGITNGQAISFRVPFKPTSSIQKQMNSVDLEKQENIQLLLNDKGRHDPCLCIRAVPCVEAMSALVIADLILHKRLNKTPNKSRSRTESSYSFT
ncbi:MAG: chorismate synthase [Chlamydiales bacterium]|nr:chorismate synthase [Chlamydiales bacterium]NCF71216.1 chorismate synthase [Chlamydiales bacterium]